MKKFALTLPAALLLGLTVGCENDLEEAQNEVAEDRQELNEALVDADEDVNEEIVEGRRDVAAARQDAADDVRDEMNEEVGEAAEELNESLAELSEEQREARREAMEEANDREVGYRPGLDPADPNLTADPDLDAPTVPVVPTEPADEPVIDDADDDLSLDSLDADPTLEVEADEDPNLEVETDDPAAEPVAGANATGDGE